MLYAIYMIYMIYTRVLYSDTICYINVVFILNLYSIYMTSSVSHVKAIKNVFYDDRVENKKNYGVIMEDDMRFVFKVCTMYKIQYCVLLLI